MKMYSFSFADGPSTKDTSVLDIASRQGGWPRTVGIGVALFLIALAPGVAGLDVFLTADETHWLKGSARFVLSLMRADWANTFHSLHPGVTTIGLGGLGLIVRYLWEGQSTTSTLVEFLQKVHPEPSLMPFFRLPIVLLTALSIMTIYFLIRRLWDSRVALLSALFLAFDPFLLAHSRVLATDAPLTLFMTLTLLSLMLALQYPRSWKMLVASGLAMGFALLSKSPASFLVLFAGLLALLTAQTEGKGIPPNQITWRLLQRLAIWGGIAALTFFVCWPAMWVSPLQALQGIWSPSMHFARVGYSNFFWGREMIEGDPGTFFYPVSFLFRSTPISLTGLAIIFIGGIEAVFRRLSSHSKLPLWDERERNGMVLCAYIVLFGAFIGLGAIKSDRYLLPVYPAADILAAVGWCSVFGWVARRVKGAVSKRWVFRGGVATFLIFQVGFSLPHYPYYLTAYNPMVGGGYLAPQVLLVGWGEGLDEAARYLSRREDAEELRIAAWYNQEFNPFTVVQAVNLNSWFSADYVVFYINQVQRGFPEAKVLDYFRSLQPEHVVHLKGIDYAWIYQMQERVPPQVLPLERLEPISFGDSMLLLGYDLDDSRVQRGGEIRLTLYWQCLKPMEESYHVYLRLLDAAGRVWLEQSTPPLSPWGALHTNRWKAGVMYRDDRRIELLPDTPPGVYRLGLSLYDPQRRLGLESAEGSETILGLVEIKWTRLGDQILLLGYDIVENREPFDGKVRINLYWRALREMREDYTIYLKLINNAYKVWGQQDSRPYWDGLPTNSWTKGQTVKDRREIDILPGTPPGLYRVEIILYDLHSGQTLEPSGGEKPLLGPVEIPRWESLSVETLGIEHPTKANLGDKVSLLGYNLESGFRPGDNLHLTLFWQCLKEMELSYTVFIHLVDAGNNIMTQKDNPPVDGFYPTTKWQAGEIVRDQYDLTIPPYAPAGDYQIKVGMYVATTGERLSILEKAGQVQDNRMGLGQVRVVGR